MLERLIKLSISLLLSPVYCIASAAKRLLGRSANANAVILYYHDIPASARSRFARQMDTLLRWATPIGADFTSLPARHARCAAVTFDDGFVSFVQNALPELEKRDIPVTLFVVTENLGRPAEWLEHTTSQSLCGEPLLTAEQLRNLPGLVTVGSHTLTHPNLTQIDTAEAKRQLFHSRIRLQEMLGRDIRLLSFPHGAFNEQLIKLSLETGYERVFTIEPRTVASNDFVAGRIWANPTDWPLEFRLKLLGAYNWLPLAFTAKRKIRAALRRVTAFRTRRYRRPAQAA